MLCSSDCILIGRKTHKNQNVLFEFIKTEWLMFAVDHTIQFLETIDGTEI